MSMSFLIWVESDNCDSVHLSLSLNCSSTAIWNVDACNVYLEGGQEKTRVSIGLNEKNL